MKSQLLIPVTESAIKKVLIIDSINLNGSISLIGSNITQSIAIEIPTVVNPNVATDSNWTPLISGGDTFILDATSDNRRSIPFRGTYRISKPASVGNAFGIRFE